MECAYRRLSRSYVIRRDLVHMKRVKCVVSGGVHDTLHTSYLVQNTNNYERLTITQF